MSARNSTRWLKLEFRWVELVGSSAASQGPFPDQGETLGWLHAETLGCIEVPPPDRANGIQCDHPRHCVHKKAEIRRDAVVDQTPD